MKFPFLATLILLVCFSSLIPIELLAQIDSSSTPAYLLKSYFRKDEQIILKSRAEVKNPFAIELSATPNFASTGYSSLNRSGIISRGITVGNNQDLSLSSGFNLQLSGKLTDDINILAAIADDNVPIQPEGNTQQIQEFDRVFIQLFNEQYSLTAGDYELRKPNSYFMYYLKKVKGAQVQTQHQVNKNISTKNSASLSIAKGKYNRMVFFGTEGVQGPYRLTGINAEQFIIVLAGTERVFIDGEPLKRGDNQDYTIDYNTAEIVFTPKRIITAYSRIIIEFEYSERSYSRSLSTISSEWNHKKWNARFNFYNEQDARNRPLLQDLSNEQKQFLSLQGDEIQNAYFSSIDSQAFSNNEIRYKKLDSLGTDIYVFSTNPEDAFYRLNFTDLGPNKGNYVLDQTLANGRVFRFVAPVSGVPQGNFEPVVLLVAPRKSSLMTLGFDQTINKNLSYSIEQGLSIQDQNLFSNIDDADNVGFATKIKIAQQQSIGGDSANAWNWSNQAQVELLSSNFRFVEFYRPVEFNRDFNVDPTIRSTEQWLSYQTSILRNNQSLLRYKLSTFLKDTFYRAFQHQVGSTFENEKVKWNAEAGLLNNDIDAGKIDSRFIKHKAIFIRKFSKIHIGVSEETEINTLANRAADTLTSISFALADYRVFIASPSSAINTYRLEYSNRLDKSPYLNQLRSTSRGHTLSFSNDINVDPDNLLGYSISYRRLEVYQNVNGLQEEDNVLGRVRYDARWFDGFIISNTFCEIGSGREPKRSFSFIQVPAGQGVYVHRDYNNNGIKEINEFEIAKFSYEADYIRISVVSNEFVRSKSNVLSQNLVLDPAQILNDKTKLNAMIGKFSNQTSFRIDRRVLNSSDNIIFNPFALNINDTDLLVLNTQIRNSTFFQRSNPIFGLEYSIQGSSGKSLLNSGFESRRLQEQALRSRWNFLGQYSFNAEIKQGEKNSSNAIAAERNYALSYAAASPEIAFQYSAALRLAITYMYQYIQNTSGIESSEQQALQGDFRYQQGGQSSFQAKLGFIFNSFTGNSNSAIAYEMLNALQVGRNITWNLNYQRNIGSNLQLSFLYEGRSAANIPAIHSGSMQARAFF